MFVKQKRVLKLLNKKFIHIFTILLITVFSGCSSKNIEQTPNKTIQINLEQNSDPVDEDQEFLDEFEDEMAVEEKPDPFASYNRAMTTFNDKMFVYVLYPISNGYKAITHKEVRSSVKRFFHNIFYPIRLVNNLLQGKLKNSFEETERFVINTTIGIFGLFDPAKSYFGIEPHNEDFGQTLGYWGVGSGPHIVLPFFGPSNLRDTFSMYPDSLANPVDYYKKRGYNLTNSTEQSIGLTVFEKVNKTTFDGDTYMKIREDAVDLYPYLRDMYEQYREKQIEE